MLGRRVEVGVVVPVEDGQRGEQRGPLPPGGRLGDPAPAELADGGVDHLGPEPGRVRDGEHARVVGARRVPVGRAARRRHRLGDEALGPDGAHRIDPGGPVVALRRGGEAFQRLRPRRVAQDLARPRRPAVGQPQRGRGRPVLAEQVGDRGDGARQPRDGGHAVAGVADRRREDVADLPRAVVAQQQEPGVDGAGDRRGQRPRAGHPVETLGAVRRRGRPGRCRALAVEHAGRRVVGGREHGGHVAAGPVEVRLHDVQHEPARDGGVEGGAAALEDAHRGGGGRPVGPRRHPDRALQHRSRGELRRRCPSRGRHRASEADPTAPTEEEYEMTTGEY